MTVLKRIHTDLREGGISFSLLLLTILTLFSWIAIGKDGSRYPWDSRAWKGAESSAPSKEEKR